MTSDKDLTDPSADIYIETDGSTGFILLNRPKKKNALNLDMWARLPDCIQALDHDRSIRTVIVTSSTAGVFSAGADISEFEQIAMDAELRELQRNRIREGQRQLARMNKPTIAMIDGFCVGAGCGISLHCDFRFASTRSKFGITPAKLGLVYPLNDTKHLVDLVGPANAKRILFTAGLFDAEQSLRMGLVDSLSSPEQLMADVKAFAADMAKQSQYSIRGMKVMIRRILDGQVDDDATTAKWFTDAHGGVDYQEGVDAFMNKRAPQFNWNE